MGFNKEEHIASYKPAVDKLVEYFKNKGIAFTPVDDYGGNVIFTSNKKSIKISHHSFYRFSGIAVEIHHISEREIKIVRVTNEMYIENYMKPVVEILLAAK